LSDNRKERRVYKLIAAGLRFPEGPVVLGNGDVLVMEIEAGRLTRIAPSGAVSVVAELGGGPNGAAIGPDGRCYVCNNGGSRWHRRDDRLMPGLVSDDYAGGWIDAVDLDGGAATRLYTACGDVALTGPNDIVFDRHGGFYFTDHGRIRRRTRDRGAVYYAQPDGSAIRKVVFPMDMPNGIGLSPDGASLYVAETMTARLWAFDVDGPGEVRMNRGGVLWEPGRLVAGLGGLHYFDSLAVDSLGRIHGATLPGQISVIDPSGAIVEQVAVDDPVPTNIAFGGPGLCTAYVTLSSTGRLASYAVDTPGEPTAFNA
jgi:gluconolactonase